MAPRHMEQDDLILLSENFAGVAKAIFPDELAPIPDAFDYIIKKSVTGDVVWGQATDRRRPLRDITLLGRLRVIGDYRAQDPMISRRNIVDVSQLGSLALRQIYDAAAETQTTFSSEALDGLRTAIGVVYDGIYKTFNSVDRPGNSDELARNILKETGVILGKEDSDTAS